MNVYKNKLLYLFSNKFHAVFDLMSILFTSWRGKMWACEPMWLCTGTADESSENTAGVTQLRLSLTATSFHVWTGLEPETMAPGGAVTVRLTSSLPRDLIILFSSTEGLSTEQYLKSWRSPYHTCIDVRPREYSKCTAVVELKIQPASLKELQNCIQSVLILRQSS